jgi:CheY-like chemotaxis protein
MKESHLKPDVLTRLIYVEDNSDDAYIFKLVFKKILPSCEIIWLRDGEELFDYLYSMNEFEERKKESAVHLIIMDINMPKIGGLDALQTIRDLKNSELQKVPIIMISTSAKQEDIEKCQALGTVNYIIKPHFYNDLITVLTDVMQKFFLSDNTPVTCI